MDTSVKVAYLNIHSLVDKLEEILDDPVFPFGDLLIFGETWLNEEDELSLQAILPTYNKENCYLNKYTHSLNNRGWGKELLPSLKKKSSH